jgi:hypothetical protein
VCCGCRFRHTKHGLDHAVPAADELTTFAKHGPCPHLMFHQETAMLNHEVTQHPDPGAPFALTGAPLEAFYRALRAHALRRMAVHQRMPDAANAAKADLVVWLIAHNDRP